MNSKSFIPFRKRWGGFATHIVTQKRNLYIALPVHTHLTGDRWNSPDTVTRILHFTSNSYKNLRNFTNIGELSSMLTMPHNLLSIGQVKSYLTARTSMLTGLAVGRKVHLVCSYICAYHSIRLLTDILLKSAEKYFQYL
jgi:hypothetical protein